MSGSAWHDTSALAPASAQAHSISALIVIVIVLACVVACVVAGLVTWSLVRFRDRNGRPFPVQSEGNKAVEILYTAIPLGIMVCLFVVTVVTMRRAEPPTDKPADLVIVAHQWWWELKYPGAGVGSANEIHLPAGIPMNVELISADVIHEVWVPRLGPKLDAVPGQPNRLVLEGDEPGVYPGACAEFCGAGHAWMRLRVVVQTPQVFEQWERAQRRFPGAADGAAARGRQVVLSRSCAECHTIAGTTAHGDAGPNLTHVASRETLASGALDNTPANLRRWLADPQAIKPGCQMPNMKLTDEQREQTVAYLESLR